MPARRPVRSPNARVPMTGFPAAVFTSTDGARSTLMPTAAGRPQRPVHRPGERRVVDRTEGSSSRVGAAGEMGQPGDVAPLLVDREGSPVLAPRRAAPA